MARIARNSKGGLIYHVLNRGEEGVRVFQRQNDYAAFVERMRQANDHLPMRVLGYSLLPDHVHFLLWPHNDGDLSRWVQWVLTSHVRRYHEIHHTYGSVWQGRFKAFPVQPDEHYLTVLKYIERNPLRLRKVSRSQDWEWSSLTPTIRSGPAGLLSKGPLPKPQRWTQIVNAAETETELELLRRSVRRGTPFGDAKWRQQAAVKLGIESTLRTRGRPMVDE